MQVSSVANTTHWMISRQCESSSLTSKAFLQFATKLLNASPVSPRKLCFDVTETAAIANLFYASRFIEKLKGLGCRFALDDFGSGFSSFAYLKNLPIDFIKIDGLFIKYICHDPLDFAMVKSINEVGHVFGKQTIAEFVEDQEILAKVRELGIDYAQGYAIGRPEPISRVTKNRVVLHTSS